MIRCGPQFIVHNLSHNIHLNGLLSRVPFSHLGPVLHSDVKLIGGLMETLGISAGFTNKGNVHPAGLKRQYLFHLLELLAAFLLCTIRENTQRISNGKLMYNTLNSYTTNWTIFSALNILRAQPLSLFFVNSKCRTARNSPCLLSNVFSPTAPRTNIMKHKLTAGTSVVRREIIPL